MFFYRCRICTETILTHFTAAFNKLRQQISQYYSESVLTFGRKPEVTWIYEAAPHQENAHSEISC